MVALSSLAGAGWQFFGNNGLPLAGGKLYTYVAGGTTPAATYTSSSGTTPHANPIILDSAGRVPSEVWLTTSASYKFILKTAANVEIWTKDNIPGILASNTIINSGQVAYTAPGTGGVAKTVGNVLDENVRADDYSTVQQAVNYASSLTVTGPPVTPGGAATTQTVLPRTELGPTIYQISTPLTHYYGQWWRGHGSAETANRLNTKIYPAVNIDAIRMSAASNNFHYGFFDNFTVMGPGSQTSPSYYSTFSAAIAALAVGAYFTCDEGAAGNVQSYQRITGSPYYQTANRGWYPYGWALNWVSPDGTIPVAIQGQTSIRRVTARNMGSGGFRVPYGALQFVSSDCTSLANGGYGFYYKAPFATQQQSVVFERFSADSATGGAAIYLDTPQIGGHLSIRDLKSEANLNTYYGNKTTVTASCSGTTLTTVGSPAIKRGAVFYAADGSYVGTVASGSGNSWVVDTGGTFASQTMTVYYQLDQKNALILSNAAVNATVTVDGLTHISAGSYFPGGSNSQMPGDAISVTGGNTPDLIWNNAQIRTLAAQTITPPTDFTGGCVAILDVYPNTDKVASITEGNTVGWTAAPTVTIAPPDTAGTQATATAVVTNGRLVFTIVTPGSGYTVAPVVTLSAPPALVTDNTYGVRIESKFTSGRYSDKTRGDFSRSNNVYWALGSVYDYVATSVEGPGWQLGGQTPGISLYAKNAAVDTRKVLLVNSSGNFSIRTVTDAGASTIALQVNNNAGITNGVQIRRALNSLGTTLIAGNWALSAGFGSTAAVTINASSKDSRFDINIAVSGTGIAANPTATLTFSDGTFATAPIGVVAGWNETDSTGVSLKWVESTTTLVITFLGTPVAGKTYRIKGVLM